MRSLTFGSRGQARELLNLIDQHPGKAEYRISHRTESDVVVFGADFTLDLLVRVHRRNDDHGTGETWKGYALERLRSAAAGGSLNDTPLGKSPGTFETFK